MLFNIIFKQYLNIFIRNFVLCIQIRFVSTEKTTRIASRASCYNLIKKPTSVTENKSSIIDNIYTNVSKNFSMISENDFYRRINDVCYLCL